jgi:hypothetical protein
LHSGSARHPIRGLLERDHEAVATGFHDVAVVRSRSGPDSSVVLGQEILPIHFAEGVRHP